jgi:CubicO group peptidase (beta-lactamase class C family)
MTAWPLGQAPAGAVAYVEAALSAESTAALGETNAVVVVQGGRLILERYAPGFGPDITCRSWSMAKSITQALVGLLVGDGLIEIHAPADVPEWQGAHDPRGAITLDHLLRMSSGLTFVEDYVPNHPSDVITMLFGEGKDDMAAFAAAFPLAHPPGSFFAYSSGTTNIVSRCAARALGADRPAFEAYMRERLFDPLGMASADPRFDAAGTFIGSSYCFATPRDFARFGRLYLQDGVWEGRRLLPEGWVDYARTPTYQQPGGDIDGPYGAHWWLDLVGQGSFSAQGYEGQYIVVSPASDLIIVRHGATPAEKQPALKAWIRDLATLFGRPPGPCGPGRRNGRPGRRRGDRYGSRWRRPHRPDAPQGSGRRPRPWRRW